MKQMKVELTLTNEMLGAEPGDKDIYRTYIASKAPDAASIEEEVAALGTDGVIEKGMTIFLRDKDGNPAISNHVIKGFFKNACKAMREADGMSSKDLKAYKSKIDNLIFINHGGPKLITIHMPKDSEIGVCSRALRAQTAQGERVALAMSESVPEKSTLEFTIDILSKDMEKYILEWLDYGEYNGLGQWHNGSKGTFTWRDLDISSKKPVKESEDEAPVKENTDETPAPKKRGRPKKEA